MEGFRSQPSERDRSLTDKDSWRHCPWKGHNPSDLLTRGISADSLINRRKWWKGPGISYKKEILFHSAGNNVLLSDEGACLEEFKPAGRKNFDCDF
ncbi:hypothetical protein TNCV_2033791 [Trichonephila clavipes]|nr:hypothetical protein TNCV_2033791 [Trichonephila clavipes]